MRRRLRRVDRVFRLGGEEFLALLDDTGADEGDKIAEELRRDVEASGVLPGQPVTVSIGIAELRPDDDPSSWMKRADENLYQAKLAGRNQVYS